MPVTPEIYMKAPEFFLDGGTMDRRHRSLLLAACLVGAVGCGLTDSKYIDYSEDGETDGTTGGTAACPDAEAEFAAQMQPTLTSTCATATCHQAQTIEGKVLSATDSAVNRAQIKAYTGTTSDKLFNKISLKGTTHSGGNLSAALPKANIDAWLAKEATCP